MSVGPRLVRRTFASDVDQTRGSILKIGTQIKDKSRRRTSIEGGRTMGRVVAAVQMTTDNVCRRVWNDVSLNRNLSKMICLSRGSIDSTVDDKVLHVVSIPTSVPR